MGGLVDYEKAQKMLSKYKIRSVQSSYVATVNEAINFAGGSPIVLKVISSKALHKSKSGLVKLNLYTDWQIKDAYGDLLKKAGRLKPYKILAQKMVQNGLEIIIGGKVDQQFGKMILLGLGGIYVETFKDFSLRTCPITGKDARAMISQMKAHKVIAPDKKSEEMIASVLIKASKMFENSRAVELDLNPVILHDGTYDAVDLRMLE